MAVDKKKAQHSNTVMSFAVVAKYCKPYCFAQNGQEKGSRRSCEFPLLDSTPPACSPERMCDFPFREHATCKSLVVSLVPHTGYSSKGVRSPRGGGLQKRFLNLVSLARMRSLSGGVW